MRVYKDDDIPLYVQAAQVLRSRILDGTFRSGDKLPSVRRLSDELGVNPATVVAAYRILGREGFISMRKGSGAYVGEISRPDASGTLTQSQAACAIRYDLSANAPPQDSYPLGDVKRYLARAVDIDGAAAFSYQESAGFQPLRLAAAKDMERCFGRGVNPQDVHVVSGAQQGLDLAARVLLRPGDVAAAENPGYPGVVAAFMAAGARVEWLDIGATGPDLAALERIARERPLRLVYVNPTLQNPSCAVYDQDVRKDLVKLAERFGFYIIEDDLMGDLAEHAPPPLASLDSSGRVIYLKSYSKSLMPGLRIAVLEASPVLRERLEEAKRAVDLSSNGLMQRVLSFFLEDGRYSEHVDAVKKRYARARAAFCLGLADARSHGASWVEPSGGLNLWLGLPPGLSGRQASALCMQAGIAVSPEAEFRQRPDGADNHLRLSFGSLPEDDVFASAQLLAKTIMGKL